MISKKMEEALNEQINAEFWSAQLYLSMAAWFESQNLSGFANWMMVQYQEENSHGIKFYNYLNERGGRVVLKPIKEFDTEWSSPLEAFEETLKHEQEVTSLINKLMKIALLEDDFATQNELKWFIDEQVEEEAGVDDIINKLKMVSNNGYGIYMIDKEFKARAFVDETLV